MDIEESVIGYTEPDTASGNGPALTPITIYSFGFDAEELLCVYGAMRTYLKVLAGQDNEDENLKMIQRTAGLLIEMKPRAIEASKALSLKAVGMEVKNAESR